MSNTEPDVRLVIVGLKIAQELVSIRRALFVCAVLLFAILLCVGKPVTTRPTAVTTAPTPH